MVKIICTENNDVNKTEVELSGEMSLIVSQLAFAIADMYTEIRKRDKDAGEAFRAAMTRAIASKDSPVWEGEECEDAICRAVLVRKGAKLTGDDIADLLRRGTPKDIIKSLLEEMEA